MRWYIKVAITIGMIGVLFCSLMFALKIETIKVEGTKIYSEQEIIDSVFTRKFSDNELFFAVYHKLFGINKLPFVEDIEVSYENRNTVTLHVYDKTISGCIQYMGQYVYFDKDGTVLQSMNENTQNALVVTGITFGKFTVGEVFQVKDKSMFSTIMNLSQLVSHYDIPVSRIHMSNGEVILYSGDIEVYLGKKKLYDDEMSALSGVLETTTKEKLAGTIHMENFEAGDKIILKTTRKK